MLYLTCDSCHLTIGTTHGSDGKLCPRCGSLLSRHAKSLFSGLPARYKSDRGRSGSRAAADIRTTRSTSASTP